MATYNDVNTMRAGQRAQAEEAGQVMADQQIRQNKIGEMVQQRGREEMAQGQRNAFMNGAQRGMQQGQEEGVQAGLRMSEEAQSGVQQQQLQSMVMQGVDQLVQATQAGHDPREVLAQMNFTEDPQTDGMIKQNIVQEFQKKWVLKEEQEENKVLKEVKD